ncbi:MAG: hypothetical protein GT589_05265 [Peptoclostridium sp.]|uniref:hypothetical protein n=1 Tax=Peptoclostridium sp. TaxID=1904860 RepID=UPI00139C79DD|nr:hypothetical protein [Peptoclostridium sp.]MZQ75553.1 hypothetical protein [Peptoclostridium sp.]
MLVHAENILGYIIYLRIFFLFEAKQSRSRQKILEKLLILSGKVYDRLKAQDVKKVVEFLQKNGRNDLL